MNCLREWRGDTHWALVVANGLTGVEASVLHNLWLGYDPEWTKQVLDGFKIRTQPDRWPAGKFIHPHDACFDKDGNIFVTEWVQTGRVSFLRHVS